ncbi:polymer-forming cytoskeletal protein [Dysgonomonas sp. 216]|uniref:bactofilin family protein n=1 Tax=Dysgonomonas sp. 216 TaxID=2302934 RepID=UPI0013D61E6A|nr:polymer-forming cytoskeletal protein [Dysgonomonas sp. 216]NDW17417.1 polymer-forming cytoskeletal protein [Dysgonomonas sp. 216]
MLNRKEVVTSSGIHNVLSSGTVLTGNLVTDDDIRIDGVIEGNIISKGKIIVGANGSVTGDIECYNLDLLGKVTGNVQCNEIVILRSASMLMGDILTRVIEIEPGAQFTGSCKMNT